jgi:transposase
MRYELANHEWIAITPMLPKKQRGVKRVNNRRVLNILWVLRSGAPWRDTAGELRLLHHLLACADRAIQC